MFASGVLAKFVYLDVSYNFETLLGKIIDIKDRNQTFQEISRGIDTLNKAFRALNADYAYHLETIYGKDHRILKMHEDIDFRLFSSQFHLELLLRQHYYIEERISAEYKANPEKILRQIFPSNPIFDYCEKEITAIFESIVFHLASVYDYLSTIISFICNNKDESISKWSNLERACRQKDNLKEKEIAKIIVKEHNNFVNPLYKYRSGLIHDKTDLHPIEFDLKLDSGKSDVKFFINKNLTKNFSELRKLAKTNKITISFGSSWLIEKTIDSLIQILVGVKEEIEKVSTFPNHVANDDLLFFYKNQQTGFMEPVSKRMWQEIETERKKL